MRFGLLMVLAVAVLVPSLSGRIVSRCELGKKLGQAFPTKMVTKGNFLIRVTCELGKRTQFNTSRLTIVGTRPPTTVKPTTSPRPVQTTGVGPVQTTGVGPVQITGVGPVTSTSTVSSQTTPGMIVTTAIQPNQTVPSGTASRRRRHAKDSHENNSHEDKNRRSIGFYGLFQLTDHIACNSGYGPTKNVCQTQCDVFLDDEIEDDIACFVKSRAWEDLLSKNRCSPKDLVNYFAECV